MKQEMIDAAHHALAGDPSTDPDATLESVLQAAINAAWTEFNPDNPDTWPKSEYAPSGMPWLCKNVSGELKSLLWDFEHIGGAFYDPIYDVFLYDIVIVCDPADLLPINTEE